MLTYSVIFCKWIFMGTGRSGTQICSGVAQGASGGTRCGSQALGAHQHTFYSHLNRVLSRNLIQSMHKNTYFLGKNVKIASALGYPPPNPRSSTPDPRVVTLTYYYNFVKVHF